MISNKDIMYMGFGLALADAKDLAERVVNQPYSYDAEGKLEHERDLEQLQYKLECLYSDYIGLKHLLGE